MDSMSVIFPGQGSQYMGMGKDLYDNFDKAKEIFDTADRILDMKISDICFNGPEDKLKSTLYQQLAIFVVSAVAWELLKEKQISLPQYFAGLSLGEYTAVYASGMLNFEQALYLVKSRAELMEKAAFNNPSTMLAVLGLKETVIKEASLKGCYVANLNSPSQVVVSVSKQEKETIQNELVSAGAKRVVELNVSGGFHSPFMEEASQKLKERIAKMEFTDCKIPVISNADAAPHTKAAEIKENLVKQLTLPVLWQKSIEYMAQQKINIFYEVGPGKVLKGLLRKIDSSLKVKNAGNLKSFQEELDSALFG